MDTLKLASKKEKRRGPGLILSANVDEEAISGSRNQCVSIRCMSSAALGSAAICGVEFGGVYLDYMWPLNYFEQQHCLLSQEVCTLGTTPKKVSIDRLKCCDVLVYNSCKEAHLHQYKSLGVLRRGFRHSFQG